MPCGLNVVEPKTMKKNYLKCLCKISTISLKCEPHELGKSIAEIVGAADGYYYISEIYQNQYTFCYNYSQSCTLAKCSRKHENLDKQYNDNMITNSIDDHESMQIFDEYKAVLLDVLEIVQEQENASNIQ
ncbi:29244_t:CDS:2 [Gigaspora margarita]|uniref:29244_t:CDS:1 n=1 Tax=Gigaspora margarita TaxID=4874 RepID=A0ABN7UQC2_GIGMA|nr:29244_t:CDS:2 [Gigaspora margarita]